MQIRTKAEFFTLWEAGVLGNRPPVWRTLNAAMIGATRDIGFRELGKSGGGAWERVSVLQAGEVYDRWTKLGRKFLMDGGVPDEHQTMQGEVCRTERGLESFLCVRNFLVSETIFLDGLRAISEPAGEMCDWIRNQITPGLPPMRVTMKNGWHKPRGYLQTRLLLDRYMDPSSRDDLDALLELYPDATIELTCFDIDTGVIPGRNTIFWEVRNY